MAATYSFDITSTVDLQEVDNAINQARKEVAQRYDFKGSTAAITLDPKASTMTLSAADGPSSSADFFTLGAGSPPQAPSPGAAATQRRVVIKLRPGRAVKRVVEAVRVIAGVVLRALPAGRADRRWL